MIRISVTQDDIDTGIRNDCGACPVAIALRRVLTELNMSDHVINVFLMSATTYKVRECGLYEVYLHFRFPP